MGWIRKRGEGWYLCVVYLGQERTTDGRPKDAKFTQTVRGTRQEAARVLRDLEEKYERGKLKRDRQTVAHYLTEWVDSVAGYSAGPTTLDSLAGPEPGPLRPIHPANLLPAVWIQGHEDEPLTPAD